MRTSKSKTWLRTVFERPCHWSMLAMLCAPVIFATGCREAGKKASISGTVRHAGNPVLSGVIWFDDPLRGRVEATPFKEGDFRIPQLVEPAVYHVYVTPEREIPEGGGLVRRKHAPDIPEKYRSAGTSGLVFTIEPGKNELTIELD